MTQSTASTTQRRAGRTPRRRGHRVHAMDVPALETGKRLKVSLLEPPKGIRVGHVVCYEPSPPRLAVDLTDHPTAELLDCPGAAVEVITEIWMLNDLTDRWLVCRGSRYELTLCPFGKAPMMPARYGPRRRP